MVSFIALAALCVAGVVNAQTVINEPLSIFKGDESIRKAVWQPAPTSYLASASGNEVLLFSSDLQLLKRFQGHTDAVLGVSWSPDGTKLASASQDQTVRIWDLEGNNLSTLTNFHDWVVNATWSPKGDLLTTTAIDYVEKFSDGGFIYYQIKMWNVSNISTPLELYTLPNEVDVARSVTWKDDGSQFVTAGNIRNYDYAANVWNSSDGNHQITIPGFYDKYIYSVEWSPRFDTLAIASEATVSLASTESGKIITALFGHDDLVTDLSWNADGILLASSSLDGTIRIWNTLTAQILLLIQNDEPVYVIDWSQDNNLLVSLDQSKTLKVWEVGKIPMNILPTVTPLPTFIYQPR